jgi:hypothetical protein
MTALLDQGLSAAEAAALVREAPEGAGVGRAGGAEVPDVSRPAVVERLDRAPQSPDALGEHRRLDGLHESAGASWPAGMCGSSGTSARTPLARTIGGARLAGTPVEAAARITGVPALQTP